MDPRSDFLLELLHKLGAPLMAAVGSHSSGADAGEQDAGTVAALLTESVKISIALSQAMNLKPGEGDADAIRVSLAALAGGLVAESYRKTGRVPGDADSRRLSKALESIIVFADNFAPAAEHAARLKTLAGPPPFFDPVQTNIYAIHALLPVIAAAAEFSFGQPETRLVQDIATRLNDKAAAIQDGLGVGNEMGNLVLLQALAQIYAGAHRAETKRLQSAGGDQNASLDAVWAAFDRQVQMVEVLMTATAGQSSARGSGGGVRPAPPAADPAEEMPPPAEAPPAQTAQAPTQPAAAAPPAGGSPMSFFKKK